MSQAPADLVDRLGQFGQEHVLTGWRELTDAQRDAFVAQLRGLDLAQLAGLYQGRDATYRLPEPDRIAPLPDVLPDEFDPEAYDRGQRALAAGQVAALVVAGGQGTRLGFDHPKGMFPVGPVTGKTLFQLHAEKVLARSRRHGAAIPFLVMTSDATHAETLAFFSAHRFFGLPADDVHFFRQGTMPALELATGKLLLEAPGRLFSGPDGHGGTLTALAKSGLLQRLADRGIRQVFYFQVDNPLVKVADPQFLGRHLRARAEVSSKVIDKDGPKDKLGNFVLIDGRLSMIEYSDLPDALATAVDAEGNLRIRAGNPAIHVFDVAFLQRVTAGAADGLPFHLARKKVPFWDPATGMTVQPEAENALKFERFIFDVLPLAARHAAVFTSRREEFAPLKNGDGADSPQTVRRAIRDQAADWLASAGVRVPASADVEVSALAALEPWDLLGRFPPGAEVTGSVE
jgi:UDP-N-acetylglucosamine/UDP-N-acetylgalactosamine diphosphorylase